jgi:hypothetical protein
MKDSSDKQLSTDVFRHGTVDEVAYWESVNVECACNLCVTVTDDQY